MPAVVFREERADDRLFDAAGNDGRHRRVDVEDAIDFNAAWLQAYQEINKLKFETAEGQLQNSSSTTRQSHSCFTG